MSDLCGHMFGGAQRTVGLVRVGFGLGGGGAGGIVIPVPRGRVPKGLVHSRRHAAIIGQDSRAYRLLHQRPPSLAARHRATERIAPLSGRHSQVWD